MIHLELEIKNPVVHFTKIDFNTVWWFNVKLSKNKSFEFDSYIDPYVLFKLMLDTTFTGQDHAGPKLELTICMFTVSLRIYDQRHWNSNDGHWYLPGEEEAEEEN